MSYNDRTESITLVAAVDVAMAIGRGGRLPWRLEADMDHFVKLTMGNPVVMGRTTYESIPKKYRPLNGRENWILTKNTNYFEPRCRIFHDADEVLRAYLGRDIFIAGGGEIYKLFLPHATRIVLTHVETLANGADTFFPEVPKDWSERLLLKHVSDAQNQFPFSIVEYRPPDEF